MTTETTTRPMLTREAFRDLVTDGMNAPEHDADVTLRAEAAFEWREVDETRRVIRMAITTERIDRYEDTIALDGWDLTAYRRNPVVLWAHDYSMLPVGRAEHLAIEEITIDGAPVRAMVADIVFTPRGMHPFNDVVYEMLAGGFLNASSVGFRPLEWSFDEERFGVNFLRQELLEFSVVPVPANGDAIAQSRSAGIDIAPIEAWAEQALAATRGAGQWVRTERGAAVPEPTTATTTTAEQREGAAAGTEGAPTTGDEHTTEETHSEEHAEDEDGISVEDLTKMLADREQRIIGEVNRRAGRLD